MQGRYPFPADANLLTGPLKLLDPVFSLVFRRIGDKAGASQARALDGHEIE